MWVTWDHPNLGLASEVGAVSLGLCPPPVKSALTQVSETNRSIETSHDYVLHTCACCICMYKRTHTQLSLTGSLAHFTTPILASPQLYQVYHHLRTFAFTVPSSWNIFPITIATPLPKLDFFFSNIF